MIEAQGRREREEGRQAECKWYRALPALEFCSMSPSVSQLMSVIILCVWVIV